MKLNSLVKDYQTDNYFDIIDEISDKEGDSDESLISQIVDTE